MTLRSSCRAIVQVAALGMAIAAHAAPPSRGADLGVAMLRSDGAQRSVISPGQPFTVSIGVHNLRGDAAARNAVLTLAVPPGLTLQQARPSPGETGQSGANAVVTWSIGDVPARALPRIFEVDLVPAGVLPKDSQIALVASVSSDDDTDKRNNRFVLQLEAKPAQPDLAVDSNLTSVALTISEPVKFTVDVSNWGTVAAAASTLTAAFPVGVTFRSSNPPAAASGKDRVSWQLGDIEAGDTATVEMEADVDPRVGATEGGGAPSEHPPLVFTFDVATTSADLDLQDNHLEVSKRVELAGADAKVWLSVDAAAEPGELPVGKDVTFKLLYGNFGNVATKDATLSLQLWEGLTFVRASQPATRTEASERFRGGVVSWAVGDLAVGQQGSVDCLVHVASVPDDGALVMASITMPGIDIDPANSQAYLWNFASHSSQHQSVVPEHHLQIGKMVVIGVLLLVVLLAVGVLVRIRLLRRR